MRVIIEIDESIEQEQVVIKCREFDERVMKMQRILAEQLKSEMTLVAAKGDREYYIPLGNILFFETENKNIQVHTKDDIYETKYKLYELEEVLPGYFMRISKSTIVNLNHIYSITRNLTASSLVEFADCHKCVYVSRNYYKLLVERLAEKSRKW